MLSNLVFDKPAILTAWMWTIIHSLWIGLVLAFIFYSILRQFPAMNARIKYRIGLALLMTLPVLAVGIFLYILPQPLQAAPVQSGSSINNTFNTVSSNGFTLFSTLTDRVYLYADSIFMLWILGVSLLSLRMLWSYIQIEKLRSNTTIITKQKLNEVFELLYKKTNISIPVKLVGTSLLQMPATIGLFRPLILMPVSLVNQLSPQETYAVLAHEFAHVIRKDYLHNLLTSLIEVLFFFHPSVWWFSSTLKSIREQCCDDMAIQLGAEKIALTKALVHLEEHAAGPSLAMSFSNKYQLLNRIQRLFNPAMKNEFNIHRSQAPVLLCSLAFLLVLSNPFTKITTTAERIPLLKAFIWDSRPAMDTVKPKSTIEKITKDNGKEKIELQLKDKKIQELKVNDKIIPPSEYQQYAEKTEALKKELREIEMPASRTRARVFSDIDPSLAPLAEEEYFIYPGERKENNKETAKPRIYSRSGEHPDAFIYRMPPGQTRSFSFGHDKLAFGFGDGKGTGKAGSLWGGDRDKIKWVIDGDSNNIVIDGDKLIIRDDKGDVIIDMKGTLAPGAWSGNFTPRAFQFQDFRHLSDDFKWKLEKELKQRHPDQWRMGDLNEKLAEDLKMNKLKMLDWVEEGKLFEEHKLKGQIDKEVWEEMNKNKLQREKLFDSEMKDQSQLFEKIRKEKVKYRSSGKLDQIIREKLVDDKIIKPGQSYTFNIDDKSLKVNGKKQTNELYQGYKELIEGHTGIELKENSNVMFNNSGSTVKDK